MEFGDLFGGLPEMKECLLQSQRIACWQSRLGVSKRARLAHHLFFVSKWEHNHARLLGMIALIVQR